MLQAYSLHGVVIVDDTSHTLSSIEGSALKVYLDEKLFKFRTSFEWSASDIVNLLCFIDFMHLREVNFSNFWHFSQV